MPARLAIFDITKVGRGRFAHSGAVEVQAFDLGAHQEPLRVVTEQEHGGMAVLCTVQQVEARQRRLHGRAWGKRVAPLDPWHARLAPRVKDGAAARMAWSKARLEILDTWLPGVAFQTAERRPWAW